METSLSRLSVAYRYANALFSLSLEEGEVTTVERQIAIISRLLEHNRVFKRFIDSPWISLSERLSVIDSLVEEMFDSEKKSLVGNLLRVLAMNGRLCFLPSVLNLFQDLLIKERREVVVFVISAHVLGAKMLLAIRKVLSSSLRRKILLQFSIDTAILGGFIIRVGSYQIDGSLRTKLSLLMSALKEVG